MICIYKSCVNVWWKNLDFVGFLLFCNESSAEKVDQSLVVWWLCMILAYTQKKSLAICMGENWNEPHTYTPKSGMLSHNSIFNFQWFGSTSKSSSHKYYSFWESLNLFYSSLFFSSPRFIFNTSALLDPSIEYYHQWYKCFEFEFWWMTLPK